MGGQAAAFMSYARFNDQHDDGQVTAFRERLAAEVRAQTGEEFVIFQDRADIAWGQNWQRRIEQALDGVSLLLVIITPGFFRSTACREEVERFAERERALGRDDLILPVYYISTPKLDDPAQRNADPLAGLLASRQHADWREMRFEPLTSPVARKAMAQLAARMRDAFWRPPADLQAPAYTHEPQAVAGPLALETEQAAQGRVTPKSEPPTHVVDAYHRGDFVTVSAAVDAARPGDRILVRPGLYLEGLVIDKPLEILGDGPVADIEIRAHDADVVSFRANIGRIANLTLQQVGGEKPWYGVDISQGRLDLEGCNVTCQAGSCVAIRDGADPRLRRNIIHDSKTAGIYVYDGGLGTVEDNDITANGVGVAIRTGGNPTVRRNTIHDDELTCVLVYENGLGTLEDNDITANASSGVEIDTGGNPILRRNTIHDCQNAGVFVRDGGLGRLEDNDITANGTGVATSTGGNPTVRHNRINQNDHVAVSIYEGGLGVFEDNDLTGNTQGAWDIAADSKDSVTLARNRE